MEKKYKISQSIDRVYSKQGGQKVVKFKTKTVTAEELKTIVRNYNYSACKWFSGSKKGSRFIADELQSGIGHCTNQSFAEMYGIVLDVDEGLPIKEALEMFKDYVGLIFTSSSHQIEKKRGSTAIPPCDRFRIFLPFDEPDYIDSAKTAKNYTKAALNRWKFSDQACVDPARKYFPTTGPAADDAKFIFEELPGDHYLGPAELADYISVGNAYDNEVEDRNTSKEIQRHNNKVPSFSLDDMILDEMKTPRSVRELFELGEETNVFCMFCDDINSEGRSAVFYPSNWKQIPSLFCQHCKSVGDGMNKNGLYYLNDDEAFDIVSKSTGNIAFVDKNTNRLYFGAYDKFLDRYQIDQKDFTTIKNSLRFHNMPIPKIIPEVRYQLVPDSDEIVDFDTGMVNRYIAPDILKSKADLGNSIKMPEYIGLILDHMIPKKDMQKHFLNWLACIVQQRKKIRTTFLLQGVQGIGKNLFYDLVIKNIFGAQYCTEVHQNRFLSNFNSFITRHVWVLVNEVGINFSTKDELASKLKPFISDMTIESEVKGQESRPDFNHCNTLFFSNRRSAVTLERSDRRFNICEYVETPIYKTSWWPGPSIERVVVPEVPDFCNYLKAYPIDLEQAVTIKDNTARQDLIALSQTNTEDFFSAIIDLDYDWLQDNLMDDFRLNGLTETALQQIITSARMTGRISRDDLYNLYINITQKNLIKSKFAKTCTEHGVKIEPIRIEGGMTRGHKFGTKMV